MGMLQTKHRLPGLAAGAALALAAGWGPPATAAEFEMIIGHMVPEDIADNEIAAALGHFEQIVEAATDGAIDVKSFGNGQLGSEIEMGQQTQEGSAMQATVISSGAASSFYRNYQIVATPFLFPNYETAWTFFDSDWFAGFMRGFLEEAKLRYLGTLDDLGGFVAFTNNQRPIRTLEDVKGLTIRTEENPAHLATMAALGASGVPLPWAEVHTALATGMADGQFNAPGVSKSFKLWEVQDFTTWSGHVYNTTNWFVSEAWFQTLPDEYQQVVLRSAREATKLGHGVAAQGAVIGWQESCKQFEECIILSAAEKQRMKDITRPAFKQWITGDFGVEEAMVDELWGKVDEIAADLDRRAVEVYGR
jgi:tripartite ATP-independent transporter DctP family solute receptor